jgi:hypothetical protein
MKIDSTTKEGKLDWPWFYSGTKGVRNPPNGTSLEFDATLRIMQLESKRLVGLVQATMIVAMDGWLSSSAFAQSKRSPSDPKVRWSLP